VLQRHQHHVGLFIEVADADLEKVLAISL
jgi:hypothetical protein